MRAFLNFNVARTGALRAWIGRSAPAFSMPGAVAAGPVPPTSKPAASTPTAHVETIHLIVSPNSRRLRSSPVVRGPDPDEASRTRR